MDFKQPKGSIFLSMLCAIFFFLWGGFLIVNPAVAATITVCYPSGCNATTIQGGINMASSGDTVLVSAGTYNENIGITKGVTVVSDGSSTPTSYTGSGHTTTAMERATETIIHGNGSDSVVRILGGTTPDVTLDGFTIENASAAYMFLVRIGGGSPTIKNNIIRNNSGFGGIGLQGILGTEVSPTIENNLIHTVNGPGIGNGPSSHAYIHHNEIWDCNGTEGSGIGLWGYAYPTIENNIIFLNNRAGIGSEYTLGGGQSAGLAAGGSGNTLTIPTIKGNTIYNNYAGIVLVRADGDSGTIDVTIGDSSAGNDISGPWASIRLEGLTNATVENNDIHDHFLAGISLGELSSATISDNEISDNEAGIEFDYNCGNAIVENNVIHHNKRAGINNGHPTIGHPVGGADTLFVQNNNQIYLNGAAGIAIEYAASTNTIQGNTIRENALAGIRVFKAASLTVQDNQIYLNGRGGIRNDGEDSLIVTGNDIYQNQRGGIEIRSGTGTIAQNTINQNQHGGIGIKTPCDFEISENQINDNLRGGIHTGEQLADGGGYLGTVGDAHLTIKKNKVYGNGQSGFGGGIDVRHADGDICNNLVYENHRGGIRFGDYIEGIVNNTVVGNGENGQGGGIVYDNLIGAVNDPPSGNPDHEIPIKNNICVDNEMAGIRTGELGAFCMTSRDYNLLCRNNGIMTDTCSSPYCILMQLGGCGKNSGEIFADPSFVGAAIDNYHLELGSPAECTGECQEASCECANASKTSMGAYGGSDPITP